VRLIFVRHGQTIYNVELRYQGHTDSELSELGRQQAIKVAERLRDEDVAAVYSSDLRRAGETAEIIARFHGLPVEADDLLRECAFGDWEGLTVAEIRDAYPELYQSYLEDSVKHRAPNGERLESLVQRVGEAVDRIVGRHPDDIVVIVGHGGTIHAFICHALGASLYSFRKIRLDNCSVTVFSLDADGRWLLEALNDTCHLE